MDLIPVPLAKSINQGKRYFYDHAKAGNDSIDTEGEVIIGFALRPKGQVIPTTQDEAEFRKAVESIALDHRWFDEPMPKNKLKA